MWVLSFSDGGGVLIICTEVLTVPNREFSTRFLSARTTKVTANTTVSTVEGTLSTVEDTLSTVEALSVCGGPKNGVFLVEKWVQNAKFHKKMMKML